MARYVGSVVNRRIEIILVTDVACQPTHIACNIVLGKFIRNYVDFLQYASETYFGWYERRIAARVNLVYSDIEDGGIEFHCADLEYYLYRSASLNIRHKAKDIVLECLAYFRGGHFASSKLGSQLEKVVHLVDRHTVYIKARASHVSARNFIFEGYGVDVNVDVHLVRQQNGVLGVFSRKANLSAYLHIEMSCRDIGGHDGNTRQYADDIVKLATGLNEEA